MKATVLFIALVVLALLTTAGIVRKVMLPAFPGAEGFGASTPGGRGGTVLLVDRLDDYAAGTMPVVGTLRWALETDIDRRGKPVDRRIIVFRIGGVIALRRPLIIATPFVTLAGQTAPGDGITIKNDAVVIATHDVIIRGIRVRVGELRQQQGRRAEPDGINISTKRSTGDVYNVIIDHCSLSWALDENGSVWATRENKHELRNVTIQWSIISEGLRDQKRRTSMGFLAGDAAKGITSHHNLLDCCVLVSERSGVMESPPIGA